MIFDAPRPKGEKRPADVIGAAIMVGRICNMTSRNAILTPFVLLLPSLLLSGCAGGKTRAGTSPTCHHGWVACLRAPTAPGHA
jgi:hypothetical protein